MFRGKVDQRLGASLWSIKAEIWISLGTFSTISPRFVSSDDEEVI